MTLSVTYVTVNGMLFSEVRDGVETIYVPDTLGSLVECRDSAGNTTYTADYWPFGQLRTSTGTNPSQWGFCRMLGYLTDTAKRRYVRARDLEVKLGRWLEVGPLWPGESAYGYCFGNPSSMIDPAGRKPCANSLLKRLMDLKISLGDIESILGCLADCAEDSFWVNWRTCVFKCLTKLGKTNLLDVLSEHACCERYSNKGHDPCDPGKFFRQEKCCDVKWCECMMSSPIPITPDKYYANAQHCKCQTTGEEGCDHYTFSGSRKRLP